MRDGSIRQTRVGARNWISPVSRLTVYLERRERRVGNIMSLLYSNVGCTLMKTMALHSFSSLYQYIPPGQ